MVRDPTHIDLIDLYSETAYVLDERRQMVAVNDGLLSPIGRFFFRRTMHGNSWLLRHDLDGATAAAIESLCRQEPVHDRLAEPPAFIEDYLRILEADYQFDAIGSGPFYWFAQAIEPRGEAIEIDSSNVELLQGELEAWRDAVPHYRPFYASVEDGRAVAVCTSVRRTRHAHVAGCETDSAYRRRGHVARAVSAWACAVQTKGAIAFYNTDWSNGASQAVAESLGAEMFAGGLDFP